MQADSGSNSNSESQRRSPHPLPTGWDRRVEADCRLVTIMELTSEDAALLLIASKNVHLKLKRERGGVNEINQSRGQYGEYHHLFPQLKADGERFFSVF